MRKIGLNKKIFIMFLSFFVALILFAVLIVLQNKIVNPYGNRTVYCAAKSIDKNTEITKTNIDSYFVKKEVPKDLLVSGYMVSKNKLLGTYFKENVIRGEQISSKQIDSISKRKKEIKNLREYSLKFDDISEVVGGTLRPGDMIDLILTQGTQDSVETQTELRNIVIDKAIAQDGTLISREDSDKRSATVLTLDLSSEDAHKLDNAISIGKVKAMKVLDSSTYNDITIKSQKQN